MTGFDPARFSAALAAGHGGRLGIVYRDHAPGAEGWIELALPDRPDLAGPGPQGGGIATGGIATLMDMATSMAVWARRGRFVPQATLDLRLDHLRAPLPGATLIGRGECYRLAGPVAFVRGIAHDGDPADPVVHVVGSFMAMDPAA